MKKALSILIIILTFSLCIFTLTACGDNANNDNGGNPPKYGELLECIATKGLVFKLINNNTEYKVSHYNGTSTEVYIPSTYYNLPVTSIGDEAFIGCTSLTSIEIPNSVTSIGYGAFSGCRSLTSIEIPDSVTSIGAWAFNYCSSLTSIEIPDSVTSIGYSAFLYCWSLTYNIKDNLKYLGNNDNKYLYLSGVENTITTATIDSSCKFIGDYAFSGCYSLESIEIPNSVTSIGDGAFAYCSSLTSIIVDENNKNYKTIDGNLYSKDGKILMQYAIGKTATSFEIPNSVTSIGNYAFSGCDSLTSIEIPNSVTSIGDWAFSDCDSLTIYCKAESQPSGWNSNWNSSNRPVVWGYKGN